MTKGKWRGSTQLMHLVRMKGGNGNFSSYSTLLIGNQCIIQRDDLWMWILTRPPSDIWKTLFREQLDAQGKRSNSIISYSNVWFHHLSSSYFNVTWGFEQGCEEIICQWIWCWMPRETYTTFTLFLKWLTVSNDSWVMYFYWPVNIYTHLMPSEQAQREIRPPYPVWHCFSSRTRPGSCWSTANTGRPSGELNHNVLQDSIYKYTIKYYVLCKQTNTQDCKTWITAIEKSTI